MVSFLSTFSLTCELYLSSWRKDWKQKQDVTTKLEQYFNKGTPLVACLMWNIIAFVTLEATVVHYAGFSTEFETFNMYAKIVPSLLGTTMYYCYKFGSQEVINALSPSTFGSWFQNWMAMQGISMVGLIQSSMLYFLGIYLHQTLLPSEWNYSISFSSEIYEDYIRLLIRFFYIQCGLCIVAIPLWKKGYDISMEAAGRDGITMTYTEILIEVIYQASQTGNQVTPQLQIIVLLTNHCGYCICSVGS